MSPLVIFLSDLPLLFFIPELWLILLHIFVFIGLLRHLKIIQELPSVFYTALNPLKIFSFVVEVELQIDVTISYLTERSSTKKVPLSASLITLVNPSLGKHRFQVITRAFPYLIQVIIFLESGFYFSYLIFLRWKNGLSFLIIFSGDLFLSGVKVKILNSFFIKLKADAWRY